MDITYLLFDNGIYGLTKGQTSPTTVVGFKTKTTPFENRNQPLNPLMMLLSYGTSWVGQAYAGNIHYLNDMITAALSHRGFSYLHILSPCVTFDKPRTLMRRPSSCSIARTARRSATTWMTSPAPPAAWCPRQSKPPSRALYPRTALVDSARISMQRSMVSSLDTIGGAS